MRRVLVVLVLLNSSLIARAADGLAADEKAIVRESVYNHVALVGSPAKDGRDVLSVPVPLKKLYTKQPRAVVDVLMKIIDGANAKESVLAAAYAIELNEGPGRGVICVRVFETTSYDKVEEHWGMTPREHWVEHIETAMKSK